MLQRAVEEDEAVSGLMIMIMVGVVEAVGGLMMMTMMMMMRWVA